ncbi:lysophospholipid acyltransferase family protein [Laceyella putida]|uniref:Lysophospholipid acyltransferase family protein n=1 Tax=Laceyella putida TaxID=110101 RepID=A0ABW2RGP8_9BACL
MLYAFLKRLLRQFLALYHRIEVIGLDRIPTNGAFILVGNHVSYADPFYIGAMIDRRVHFMAKQEAFKISLFRWFLHFAGAFPVNREKPEAQTIRTALGYLDRGGVVGIFPEGGIRGDNHFEELKQGASYLAVKKNCLIIPVFIQGAERALPKGSFWLRPVKITIKIGQAITPPQSGTAKEKQKAVSLAMQRQLRLLKEGTQHVQTG